MTLTNRLLACACAASWISAACTSSNVPSEPPQVATIMPGDLVFTGMCDASGAVALPDGRFIVADDEDNVLRIYDSANPGAPLQGTDVSTFLRVPKKKKPQEADIEAATAVAGVALWLTSHGRSSKGKVQTGRFRLFATTLNEAGEITPVGEPYERLLDDLLSAPQFAALGLNAASQIAPKQPGGLNLEGLTERPDNSSVWIGFRNPRPNNQALVIAVLNPLDVIRGERAQFGEHALLDMGGLGIRGMSYWHSQYLILGGAVANERESRLFLWDGQDTTPTAVRSLDLQGLNPEGFVAYEDSNRVLLLSDDGNALIGDVACKRLTDPDQKRFRARWVDIVAE